MNGIEYGIPYAYLLPPEKPYYLPEITGISLSLPAITQPSVSLVLPFRPSIPSFTGTEPQTPIVIEPSIGWFSISIPVPSFESLSIPTHSKTQYILPDLTPPDSFPEVPEPPEPDYDKFKTEFIEPEFVFIPFYGKIPQLKEIEDFVIGDFNGHLTIPENKLETLEVNYEELISKLQGSVNFETSPVKGKYLSNIGKRPLFYFEKEFNYLLSLYRDFISSFENIKSLSSLIEGMRAYIIAERDKFARHLSEKERQFLLFNFFSSSLEASIRARERKIAVMLSQAEKKLRDVIAINQGEFSIKEMQERINQLQMQRGARYIQRNARNLERYTLINRAMREVFRLYAQGFVVATTIEALNVERDRLIIEKANVLARLEAISGREDLMNKEREVLLERDKVISERINLINAEIESLQKNLEAVQKTFEANWASVEARLATLSARSDVLKVEGELAEIRGERDLNRAYFRGYSRYIDTFVRLNRNYWQTYYDIRRYPLMVERELAESSLEIFRAVQEFDEYIMPLYRMFYSYCMRDLACAHAIARARLQAQIIESFT